LKKQGVLALTFINKLDYDKILEDDTFAFMDLAEFQTGKKIKIKIIHNDVSVDIVECNHTYNEAQIAWFRAGSALNLIRESQG
jgi:aconitate hydratase